ncbi:MAG: TatD family hydrolase [Betaproteobacteria bacterium]|nr:TatD family hydrolase [Betaproteobacteria bacterium]
MWIDTHSHLDAAEFDLDREAVYARARAAGVTRQIIPAVSRPNMAAVADLCRRSPGCLPAWGLHPIYTHQPDDIAAVRAQIEGWRPVAVGEIGLDLFADHPDFAAQEQIFVAQLELAREYDLPVIVHSRRAVDLCLKHLRRIRVPGGIAHAFSGSAQQAQAFIDLGFKLGFGGAFTYSRATRLRQLAADLPLSALVLETDSPDIPPAWLPPDARRNEPCELPRIAAELARLRGVDTATIAAATSANACAVLRLEA